MKRYGPSSGVTRVKVSGPDFGEIRELVRTAPDRATQDIADRLRPIAADAVREMRTTIEQAVTKTGAAAQAKGLRSTAGRVRSREEASRSNRPRVAGKSMRDSVDQVVRVNKRTVSMRFGWLNGRPGYAFFQEYGTGNGVPAMHALTNARLNADTKVKRVLYGN